MVVGILGALVAAEGLNRFGSFMSAFDSADSPFYMAMLVISVIGAGCPAIRSISYSFFETEPQRY